MCKATGESYSGMHSNCLTGIGMMIYRLLDKDRLEGLKFSLGNGEGGFNEKLSQSVTIFNFQENLSIDASEKD